MNGLAHSFWTKPAKLTRWEENEQIRKNIWYFATSAAFAQRNNIPIELHTDNLGADLLGFLPYQKIHRTLENFNVDVRFWAAGKFEAYKHLKAGVIHIDGDVFIKREVTKQAINFDGYDAIFQNYENIFSGNDYGCSVYKKNLDLVRQAHALPEWFSDRLKPYNCGLIGFNNMEIKEEYISTYFSVLEQISGTRSLQQYTVGAHDVCFDLVIEQWLIASLLHNKHNAKVKTLFDGDIHFGGEIARNLGYTHVIGKWKYSAEAMGKVKNCLRQLDNNLHNHIVRHYE